MLLAETGFGSNAVTNGLYVALLVAAIATFCANWKSASASEKSAKASEDNAKAASRLSDETRELLKETVAARMMAERHHQDNLRPILVFDGSLTVTDRKEAGEKSSYTYTFTFGGVLRNVGGGPAVSIQCALTPVSQSERPLNLPRVLGPNSETHFVESWSSFAGEYREDGDVFPFDLILQYSTIGFTLKAGVTKQRSHSGSARHLVIDFITPTNAVEDIPS